MNPKTYRSIFCTTLVILLFLLKAPVASAYGVLTHQAVVDASWQTSLQPLLKKRFPKATEQELRKAHAHAYGGSIMQDMGYYPFGSVFFTDLVHYVRSGDFVENLIKNSQTLDEYAFALGALAHYNADIYGHQLGTNKAVALVYPKAKQEHGAVVTYAEDPVSHVKTEFGFDVLQVARGNYATENYQDFIGFEVSKEVLEKAFLQTYGLELGEVFVSLPLAIGSYRYTIRNIFPDLTKAAWQAKKSDIRKARPSITRRQFMYRMSKASFHKNYGQEYEKPNLIAQFLAWVMRIAPKVGPLRPLAFKPPTPEAEKLFMESFNTTLLNYNAMLQKMLQHNELQLRNMQLDTGKPTRAGDYKLTDKTYSELLVKLEKNEFKQMPTDLQQNILLFYRNTKAPNAAKQDNEEWQQTIAALEKLKAINL
ncbi:zinc dependent phospholipase C family protein [Pontibacter vulgaris]|uniref:zinc dependent phospholipase C family protein n=1 Tax=Pontibacter vulgaris TaxID=2905679 RepID=UPI001FA7F166|nr:zinc dependent phospholipase C family protein [Pontibacter vulgaris]